MSTTPKILASGQVAAVKGTIFTATTTTIVRLVTFVHVSGGTQDVVLYVKKSAGTSRVVSRAELEINEFAHEEDIITLEAGDTLEAATTNATSVDFVVTGAEFA